MGFLRGGTAKNCARVECELRCITKCSNLAILLLGHYIYGAGMWLILRQCALCGKSHDGLITSLGGIGPPAGAATISGICWVYGGVLHCIWTLFGPCNPFVICLASPDASELCAVCNDEQPKKKLMIL